MYSGTSMASPHVAGAAALILSKYPGLSVANVKSAILTSVGRLKSMSNTVSGGILDVAGALTKAGTLTDGASASGGSSGGASGSGSPSGKGHGTGLTQRLVGGTNVDRGDTASPVVRLILDGVPIQVSASLGEAYRLSAVVYGVYPLLPRPQTGVQLQVGGMSVSTSIAGDEETPAPEIFGDGGLVSESAALTGNISDARPTVAGVTPAVSPAPGNESAPPAVAEGNGDAPVSEPAALVSRAESESSTTGFLAEVLSGGVSKIFWLAGAALFFAHGAFLSKSNANIEETDRERRFAR